MYFEGFKRVCYDHLDIPKNFLYEENILMSYALAVSPIIDESEKLLDGQVHDCLT